MAKSILLCLSCGCLSGLGIGTMICPKCGGLMVITYGEFPLKGAVIKV